MTRKSKSTERNTIHDFGRQWDRFPDPIDCFHSSTEIFLDTLQGLYDPSRLRGKQVLEVGSGSGRVLEILRRYGPALLVGVEPSSSAAALRNRFSDDPSVEIIQAEGTVSLESRFDVCFLIGVLHHIPEPLPVLENIRGSLAEDGDLIVWVYGREGLAGIGVAMIRLLRIVTVRMPDRVVNELSKVLSHVVRTYGLLARRSTRMRLPLEGYLTNVFLRCSRAKQTEIIFDQLNPQCARYYTQPELQLQLKQAGFTTVTLNSRHGYSITARARR